MNLGTEEAEEGDGARTSIARLTPTGGDQDEMALGRGMGNKGPKGDDNDNWADRQLEIEHRPGLSSGAIQLAAKSISL